MKLERKGPAAGQVEYHWRVDREQGFETAKFIYDRDGRLMAVDYGRRKTQPREAAPPQEQPRA